MKLRDVIFGLVTIIISVIVTFMVLGDELKSEQTHKEDPAAIFTGPKKTMTFTKFQVMEADGSPAMDVHKGVTVAIFNYDGEGGLKLTHAFAPAPLYLVDNHEPAVYIDKDTAKKSYLDVEGGAASVYYDGETLVIGNRTAGYLIMIP